VYPPAFTSAQATVRAYGIVLVIVFGSAVAFVGGEAIGPHGGGGGGTGHWNVAFANASDSLAGATGNAALRSTTDVMVTVNATFITNVTFAITYRDNTISPLFNPAVSATITGPGGAGTASGSVPAAGAEITVTVPNVMPENATVEAATPEEAAEKAAPGNNMTLGSGEWTVSLQVGSPLGPRPGGSITYDISVEVAYFIVTVSRA
jgi:hypothetical protein